MLKLSKLPFFILFLILSCSSDDDNIQEVTAELESFIFSSNADNSGEEFGFSIVLSNLNDVGVIGYPVVVTRVTPNPNTGVDTYNTAIIYNDDCNQIDANTQCIHSYYFIGAFGNPDYNDNIEIISISYEIESTY